MGRTKVICCSKCKKRLFYMPSEYKMILRVVCVECEEKKTKKPKKKKKTTAASNYAKIKRGIRKDVHPTYFFRSPTEANFARILQFLKIDWTFEERSFTFDGFGYKTRPYVYIMDFGIVNPKKKKVPEGFDSRWIEVKGYMDARSRNKLTRLKKCYPEDAADLTVVIYDKYKKKDIEFCEKKGFKYIFYSDLAKEYESKIPNWE